MASSNLQNLLVPLALMAPPTVALQVGGLEIPLDNSVSVAVMLILSFLTLVAVQHLRATSNVAKAVAASKPSIAEPKTVPKHTPAPKKQRKKTPASKKRLSKSSSLNKVVKVTFEGSFGLRIECGTRGNVFVSGFVDKNVDLRIQRGMYITYLNKTKVPEIRKIDDMVRLINEEKCHGPVTVTFERVANF